MHEFKGVDIFERFNRLPYDVSHSGEWIWTKLVRLLKLVPTHSGTEKA